MSTSTSPASPAASAFVFEGPLVIATVADWQRRLADYCSAVSAPQLDLGAVTAIDAFGLQLLAAAQRSTAGRGQVLRATRLPACFPTACATAGLAPTALFPSQP